MIVLKHAGDQFIISGLIDVLLRSVITIHVLLLGTSLGFKKIDMRTKIEAFFKNLRKLKQTKEYI